VRSDIGIIARISLIVRNLVKQGFWQDAIGLPENKIPTTKIEKCFFEKVIIFV
jgi:hypothetical protein